MSGPIKVKETVLVLAAPGKGRANQTAVVREILRAGNGRVFAYRLEFGLGRTRVVAADRVRPFSHEIAQAAVRTGDAMLEDAKSAVDFKGTQGELK